MVRRRRTYSGNGQTSTARNMYVHGITYGPDGRLHAAFTWREQNFGVLCHPGGLSNHDTGYVYSDDRGRTWRNDAARSSAPPAPRTRWPWTIRGWSSTRSTRTTR